MREGTKGQRASKRLRLPPPLLTLILLIAGCRGAATPAPQVATATPPPVILNVGVSSSAAAFAGLVDQPYAEQTERAAVNFVVGNNATLFQDLAAGDVDAILVHHIPAGSDHWFNPVAMDALTVVVHPNNAVREVSRPQVQAIYSGRAGNWAEVGGTERPILLVGREVGAGTRALFNQRIMAEQRMSINTVVQSGNDALLETVASDPAAIGYTMMGAIAGRQDVVAVAIDGVAPTPNQAGTQMYPLTAPLYFVASGEPAGPDAAGSELRAFLAWLQSAAGQNIVGEKYGRVR